MPLGNLSLPKHSAEASISYRPVEVGGAVVALKTYAKWLKVGPLYVR